MSNTSRFPISMESTVVATHDQVSSELADEAVILHLANGVYYSLNPTGTEIWQMLQQPQTVQTIHDELLAHYDIEPSHCASDLLALLEELATKGLIKVEQPGHR